MDHFDYTEGDYHNPETGIQICKGLSHKNKSNLPSLDLILKDIVNQEKFSEGDFVDCFTRLISSDQSFSGMLLVTSIMRQLRTMEDLNIRAPLSISAMPQGLRKSSLRALFSIKEHSVMDT